MLQGEKYNIAVSFDQAILAGNICTDTPEDSASIIIKEDKTEFKLLARNKHPPEPISRANYSKQRYSQLKTANFPGFIYLET